MVKGEIVKFLTEDLIELQGFFADSDNETGLLHIHGLSGNFYENSFVDYVADMAAKKKITFLSINTRGHDYVNELVKIHDKKFKIVSIGGALEKFEDCILDIKSGIDFLKSKGCKKIILQGHSSGCQRISFYQSETRDSSVVGMILLAPADDMNITKKLLGSEMDKTLNVVRDMVDSGKANTILQNISGLPVVSAGRFNSLTNPESKEAQLFNYEGEMESVSSITVPMLAVFGSNDVYLTMPSDETLDILKSRARKSKCNTAVIKYAPHNFRGHEKELISILEKWLDSVI